MSDETGQSVLDEVRALYRAELKDETLKVPVNRRAKGKVVIVYREQDWLDTQESRAEWLSKIETEPRAELYATAEVLAKSCVDVLLRKDEHPDAEPVDGLPGKYLTGAGLGGGSASFQAAAQAFGLPCDDALQAVFAILANDWEVERHGKILAAWEPSELGPEEADAVRGKSGPQD